MAGFHFLVGAPDPNSLPGLLRQRMISPGLVPGPVPKPQLVSGFRAPALGSTGGMSGLGSMAAPPPAQQPGFNIRDSLAALRDALAKFPKNPPADPMTPGVPTPQGDPTGGAGPAFLGGNTSLGADPSVTNIDPLSGMPLLNPSWENFRA
jgi:hypothetical protein